MRCTACDKPLDPEEIIWHEDRRQFEECCAVCKEIAFASLGLQGYLSDERAIALSRKAASRYVFELTRLEAHDGDS